MDDPRKLGVFKEVTTHGPRKGWFWKTNFGSGNSQGVSVCFHPFFFQTKESSIFQRLLKWDETDSVTPIGVNFKRKL